MDGYNRGKPLTGLLGRTLPGSFFSGQPGPRQTYQQGPARGGGVTGGNLEPRQTITPRYGNMENRQTLLPGNAPRMGNGVMRPGGNMEQFPTIRPDAGRWHAITPQRPGSWRDHFYNLIRRNGFGG